MEFVAKRVYFCYVFFMNSKWLIYMSISVVSQGRDLDETRPFNNTFY